MMVLLIIFLSYLYNDNNLQQDTFSTDDPFVEYTPSLVLIESPTYRCVICGRGIKDGVEIHADHIKPKDLGGKAEIENGQTLCAQHNFQKKNYKQTETGKKMFICLYELAKKHNDKKLQIFCTDVLSEYEKHEINCHIAWKK
ncbi:MAG: HNH endonuclease [Nitrospinae bacterium]|nr:HNH endonuclease [Nitrospinota bacterium]